MARQRGDFEDAIFQYREAVKIRPDKQSYVVRLARTLASCPDSHLRDAEEAIVLMEALDPSGSASDVDRLDVLSMSYASAERFDDAVRVATQAADLANSFDLVFMRQEIEARRALYSENKMYSESEKRPRG